jgi:hypothetical protein
MNHQPTLILLAFLLALYGFFYRSSTVLKHTELMLQLLSFY